MPDITLLGFSGSSGGSTYNDYFLLGRFPCLFSGSLKYIYLRFGGNTKAKAAVYSDISGSPGSLLSSSAEVDCVAGWNSVPIPNINISKDIYYWLALIYESGVTCYYGASGSGTRYLRSAVYSGFSFPDPAGSGFSGSTRALTVYGYGTEAAAGCPRQAMHMRRLM